MALRQLIIFMVLVWCVALSSCVGLSVEKTATTFKANYFSILEDKEMKNIYLIAPGGWIAGAGDISTVDKLNVISQDAIEVLKVMP